MRISVDAASREVADKSDLKAFFLYRPLVRNCTVKGGTWDCLTRTRNGYTRFENCKLVGPKDRFTTVRSLRDAF